MLKQELSSGWDGRPFGHNRQGPKSGAGLLCPFPWGRAGSPSNTVWHLDPSNRLATVHQRYKYDRHTGQRPRSIGRTFTCNGRPMNCQYHSRWGREMRPSKFRLQSQRVQCRMNVTGWRRRVFGSHECVDAWQLMTVLWMITIYKSSRRLGRLECLLHRSLGRSL